MVQLGAQEKEEMDLGEKLAAFATPFQSTKMTNQTPATSPSNNIAIISLKKK